MPDPFEFYEQRIKELEGQRDALVDACDGLRDCLIDWIEVADRDEDVADDNAAIETANAAIRAAHPERGGEAMGDYTVTISGTERGDGEKPYTYVVSARNSVEAVEVAMFHHGRRPDLKVEEVVAGIPADNCGFYWNDRREVK